MTLKHIGGEADVAERRMKYARVERERRYLLAELPEGLTPASPHTQIFDNYLTDTRLRLRKIRHPERREWTFKLTQKFTPDSADLSRTLISNIYLSRYEYEVLAVFEGNEIRKNRYPFEFGGRKFSVDAFLGRLHGLFLAETEFDTDEELEAFTALPAFAAFEVTHDKTFSGASLVDLTTDDLRARLATRAATAGTEG